MILAQEPVLPRVAQLVELVAPVAREVEPSDWCLRCEVRCDERVGLVGVCEAIQVLDGVPEGAAVGFVV